ncbi:hypothetical protein HMPREF1602_03004 [Escherichia coli 907889]|nr:hypothetical protein HMPREF1602_03004 [Escherichia coli 907889]
MSPGCSRKTICQPQGIADSAPFMLLWLFFLTAIVQKSIN